MKNGFVLEFDAPVKPFLESEQKDETERLCQALCKLGAHCDSVLQRSFYGWDFVGKFEGRRYLFVVQVVDTRWSVSAAQSGYINWFTAKHSLRESLTRLETLTICAITNEFQVEPVKLGWGFFGLSI